ncbi:putative secreted protein [Streptomyces davaonensis JCM 4913]|uniref:Putative secreted protein n=1 Tax=Streptomyces davaonensis (strain DSM 101723 / JCM 4913 / KCC S-0913 / 768) TaxID=1214101 RepID=K4QXI5_STRDJ|nr:hypothetical protein [Streptomyces davaonensis]CCK25089.1 putative secreted protein [Streptomyces davaonensis JCM 4913]
MRARFTLLPAALTATVLATAGDAAAHDGPLLGVSNHAPVVSVVNDIELDDPLEDVLEHTLNFGDGYHWE